MSISVALKDAQGKVLQSGQAEGFLHLAVEREYAPGDCLEVTGAEHLTVQIDPTLTEGEVYALKRLHDLFRSPFTWSATAYPPHAFGR